MDKILNFFSYNPTLVSGAMDILVIKQPNGTYKGTPLRVKFGQWSILKPKEKEEKLKINDNIINIPIKLNESGEAYIKKKNKIKIKSFDNNKSENGSSNSMSDNSGISVDENIRNSNENSPEKNDDKIVFDDKKEKDDNDLNIKSYTINDENIKNEDNKIIIQNIDNNNNSNKINNLLQNENIKEDSYNCQNEKNQFKLELSDCWNIISKNKNKKNFSLKTEFEKNKISKEQFFKDPWKILNSNNLAIKIDNNIYTWKVVAPMILAELAFDSPLPEDSFNNLTQSQGGLFWKTIYKDTYKIDINEIEENNNENIKSENNNSTSSNSPQLNSKKHNNLSPNQNNSNSPLKISSSSFSNNSSGKNSPSLKSNNKKKYQNIKKVMYLHQINFHL